MQLYFRFKMAGGFNQFGGKFGFNVFGRDGGFVSNNARLPMDPK